MNMKKNFIAASLVAFVIASPLSAMQAGDQKIKNWLVKEINISEADATALIENYGDFQVESLHKRWENAQDSFNRNSRKKNKRLNRVDRKAELAGYQADFDNVKQEITNELNKALMSSKCRDIVVYQDSSEILKPANIELLEALERTQAKYPVSHLSAQDAFVKKAFQSPVIDVRFESLQNIEGLGQVSAVKVVDGKIVAVVADDATTDDKKTNKESKAQLPNAGKGKNKPKQEPDILKSSAPKQPAQKKPVDQNKADENKADENKANDNKVDDKKGDLKNPSQGFLSSLPVKSLAFGFVGLGGASLVCWKLYKKSSYYQAGLLQTLQAKVATMVASIGTQEVVDAQLPAIEVSELTRLTDEEREQLNQAHADLMVAFENAQQSAAINGASRGQACEQLKAAHAQWDTLVNDCRDSVQNSSVSLW